MKKFITLLCISFVAFNGNSQLPDSSKIDKKTIFVPDLLQSGITDTRNNNPETLILIDDDDDVEVDMDMDEMRMADSTLFSIGGNKVIQTDTVLIKLEPNDYFVLDPKISQKDDVNPEFRTFINTERQEFKNSKMNKATVPDLNSSYEITIQSSKRNSTQNVTNLNNATSATYIVENFPHRGVSVFLEGDTKSVRKAWKAYVYETNRIKLKTKNPKSVKNQKKTAYYKAANVELTNVTSRFGDLITIFHKENGVMKMTVIYKLGYNVSISRESYPEDFQRLTKYVDNFSQLNFIEYYNENIENLQAALKVIKKETKKENRILMKLENKSERAMAENGSDPYQALAIETQKKLLNKLILEKSFYEYQIQQYKNEKSDVRMKSVN